VIVLVVVVVVVVVIIIICRNGISQQQGSRIYESYPDRRYITLATDSIAKQFYSRII